NEQAVLDSPQSPLQACWFARAVGRGCPAGLSAAANSGFWHGSSVRDESEVRAILFACRQFCANGARLGRQEVMRLHSAGVVKVGMRSVREAGKVCPTTTTWLQHDRNAVGVAAWPESVHGCRLAFEQNSNTEFTLLRESFSCVLKRLAKTARPVSSRRKVGG